MRILCGDAAYVNRISCLRYTMSIAFLCKFGVFTDDLHINQYFNSSTQTFRTANMHTKVATDDANFETSTRSNGTRLYNVYSVLTCEHHVRRDSHSAFCTYNINFNHRTGPLGRRCLVFRRALL